MSRQRICSERRDGKRCPAGIAIAGAALWLAPGAAVAQTLDYASLEALFGEPVTTSVTGSAQRASEVPASMEIIDADEIRRSGARDLPGLLRHVVGVDVQRTAHDHADVAVRGYNQSYTPRLLVLLDGRQVYADYYGFTPWTTIPVELAAIRQIEVVRGPNSALFGFNAVGGVVNIITYDPLDDVPALASVMAGTQALMQLSAAAGVRFGERAGVRVSAGRRSNDEFDTPQAPAHLGSRRGNMREALNVEGALRIGERMTATLELTRTDADQTDRGPSYEDTFASYEVESVRAKVVADTRVGLIEGTVYRNDIFEHVYERDGQLPWFTFDSDVAVARVDGVSKVAPEHTLRLSAEFRESALATTPLRVAEVSYDVTSLGGMWEWQIMENLTLTNALRFDRLELARSGAVPPGYGLTNADWNRDLSETGYNGGVVWRLNDASSLRFTIGRGVQLPSLFALGGLLLPTPPFGYATGLPTLEPTTVTSYEASFERVLAAWGATLRVSAFAGKSRDLAANIGGTDFAAGLVSIPVNIGSSTSRGLEVAIRGELTGGWRWGASYTPMKIDDDIVPQYPLLITAIDFENTTPEHVLNANVGWSSGPWEVDAYLRYQSRTYGIATSMAGALFAALEPIADFVTIDARVGYRVNDRVSVAVSAQGLAHDEQRQTSGVDVERRILGSVVVSF